MSAQNVCCLFDINWTISNYTTLCLKKRPILPFAVTLIWDNRKIKQPFSDIYRLTGLWTVRKIAHETGCIIIIIIIIIIIMKSYMKYTIKTHKKTIKTQTN